MAYEVLSNSLRGMHVKRRSSNYLGSVVIAATAAVLLLFPDKAPRSFARDQASEAAVDRITFKLQDGRNLRDSESLKIKSTVASGSTVSIDPEFLREHLGTSEPTAQQLKNFLYNP